MSETFPGAPFPDNCRACNDNVIRSPASVLSIKGTYATFGFACERGHRWKCTFALDPVWSRMLLQRQPGAFRDLAPSINDTDNASLRGRPGASSRGHADAHGCADPRGAMESCSVATRRHGRGALRDRQRDQPPRRGSGRDREPDTARMIRSRNWRDSARFGSTVRESCSCPHHRASPAQGCACEPRHPVASRRASSR